MSAPRANPLHAGYDETLLSETPEVSRAAKQEGYNVDLLDEPSPVRGGQTTRGTDPESLVLKDYYNTTRSSRAGARKKVPWWRTRDGIIVIAVLAIIVVGAIVGGAVGGTVGRHKNNSTPQQGISTNTTALQQQGAEAASSNSNSTSGAPADTAKESAQSSTAAPVSP